MCNRFTVSIFAGFLCLMSSGSSAIADSKPIPLDATVKIDSQTKAVLKGALKYLASKQRLDGSWSLGEGEMGHPVAMTGYTLLAFMVMGNLPAQGDYAKNVAAGMQFLLDSIQPDGIYRGVSSGQYMYNHGIATTALAELYGESHSPAIRPKLVRALGVIIKAQNPAGGWRYTPNPNDADISVTVIQVVALRAAQESGLSIPQESINRAIDYVHSSRNSDNGFAYQAGIGDSGFARTAAAIYSLQVLGKYDDSMVKAGSAYLLAHQQDQQFWTYANYYAAPAQYMIGGQTWRDWYALTKDKLMGFVTRNGEMAHWEPKLDPGSNGSIFATAVAVHILAMPYHLIPLYQR